MGWVLLPRNGLKVRTLRNKEHPMDSQATVDRDKASVASRHWAKSSCLCCGDSRGQDEKGVLNCLLD